MRTRVLFAAATVAALVVPSAPAFAAPAGTAPATAPGVGAAAATANRVQLAAAPKTITGTVKSIDKAKLSISVTVVVPKVGKRKATTKVVTVRLGARATLMRNDSPTTLDALAVGDTISVTVVGNRATKVDAKLKGWRTDSVGGTVKKVNAATRQLIVNVTVKKKARAVSLKVAADALITARGTVGTLADIVVGDAVSATLGGTGKALNAIRITSTAPVSKTVRLSGTVVSVNAAKGILTVRVKNTKKTAAAKPAPAFTNITLRVGASDRIIVGGVPTRLLDIPVGGVVSVKATETVGFGYDVDDVVITDDKAPSISLRVLATKTDRAAGTVTVAPVEDRGDEVTLPIADTAPVTYNGTEASLDDIPANAPASIRVEITSAGTTIVALDALTPRSITMRVVGTLLLVDTVNNRIALRSGDQVGEGRLRTFAVGTSAVITRGGATVALDGLAAGDKVAVTVARGVDGKLTATAISATAAPSSRVVVQGVLVSAIAAGVVKVAMPTEKGSGLKVRAFSLAPDATLNRDGDEVAVEDFEAGDLLTLTLTRVNDTVTVVQIDAAASASAQITVRGRIDAVDAEASTIAIDTDENVDSYDVSGSARILRNKSAATLADLQEGDRVEAIVRVSGDGSSTVVAVNANGRRSDRKALRFDGEVTEIDSDAGTLTVADSENDDERVVVVDDTTGIRIGERDASFADVLVGDRVSVIARRGAGNTLTALVVKVKPMRVARFDVTLDDVNVDDSQVQLAVDGRDGDPLVVDVTDMSGLVLDGTPVGLEDLANAIGGAGQAVVVRRGITWTLMALLIESPSDDNGDDSGQCTDPGDDSGDSADDPGDESGHEPGLRARSASMSESGDECGDPTPPTCDVTDESTDGSTDQPSEDPSQEPTDDPNGDTTDECGDPTPPVCDVTDQPTDGATDQPSEDPSQEPTDDPNGDTTDECGDPTPPVCDVTDEPTDGSTDPGFSGSAALSGIPNVEPTDGGDGGTGDGSDPGTGDECGDPVSEPGLRPA